MERCGVCGESAFHEIHDMSEKAFDIVEKAEHYNMGDIECIDALRAAGSNDENAFQAWLRLTCIKYLWRLPHKDKPLEDAKKTRYYLRKLIEELERQPEQ